MPRKKKQTNSEYSGYPFSHYVDDEDSTLYVHYYTWAGSMGAHVLGHKIWPDYKIEHSTLEKLEELRNDRLDNHKKRTGSARSDLHPGPSNHDGDPSES